MASSVNGFGWNFEYLVVGSWLQVEFHNINSRELEKIVYYLGLLKQEREICNHQISQYVKQYKNQ